MTLIEIHLINYISGISDHQWCQRGVAITTGKNSLYAIERGSELKTKHSRTSSFGKRSHSQQSLLRQMASESWVVAPSEE